MEAKLPPQMCASPCSRKQDSAEMLKDKEQITHNVL